MAVSAFSQDELATFKEAFCLFDRDGDGRMGVEVLGTAMRAVGGKPPKNC